LNTMAAPSTTQPSISPRSKDEAVTVGIRMRPLLPKDLAEGARECMRKWGVRRRSRSQTLDGSIVGSRTPRGVVRVAIDVELGHHAVDGSLHETASAQSGRFLGGGGERASVLSLGGHSGGIAARGMPWFFFLALHCALSEACARCVAPCTGGKAERALSMAAAEQSQLSHSSKRK